MTDDERRKYTLRLPGELADELEREAETAGLPLAQYLRMVLRRRDRTGVPPGDSGVARRERVDELAAELDRAHDRLDDHSEQVETLEQRVDRHGGRLERVGDRLDRLADELETVDERVDRLGSDGAPLSSGGGTTDDGRETGADDGETPSDTAATERAPFDGRRRARRPCARLTAP